jgi:acyl carrier protein
MLALEDSFDLEFPDQMLNRVVFSSIRSIADAIGALKDGGS